MENLFAYGTLMCEDIMEEVSGCRLAPAPAVLPGYSRRCVKGESYPGLLADQDGHVEGVLYRNIPVSAWQRLDRFEGEMYARQVVQVSLRDGEALTASTYVVRPEFSHRLSQSEWNFAEFLRSGKRAFQSQYKGFESLHSEKRSR